MKKNKNLLTKEQVIQTINERWFDSVVNKYKNEFKEFFIKLKKQFKYNANGRRIMSEYVKTKHISKEDQVILKTIITDTLKMVGLGGIVIPIPGGVALVMLLITMAKKFNVDILPSQFENDKEIKEN